MLLNINITLCFIITNNYLNFKIFFKKYINIIENAMNNKRNLLSKFYINTKYTLCQNV
jgi:hypothetical protein